MEAAPLAAETIRISFAGLSSSLAGQGGCCQELTNAADVEVKCVTEDGGKQTARGHLSAEHGAVLHLAIPGNVAITSLTVELSEVGYGNVVAIGATAGCAFRNSCVGDLEVALICPDVLEFAGSLQASFIRTGAKLSGNIRNTNIHRDTEARLRPTGLLACGEFACVPSSVTLRSAEAGYQYEAQVSRSALGPLSGSVPPLGSGGEPVVLELCAGDADLPGGSTDLNILAAKAVHVLADSANAVVALATKDVQVATVLMAIAPPDTPAIWTGTRKDVAKRLRMPASCHPDFYSGIYVEKKEPLPSDSDDDTEGHEVLVLPAKLLGGSDSKGEDDPENDNRLKRKKSSVRWASPLSTRCSIKEGGEGA